MKKIIIAGGCFWGVEHYYKRLKGVTHTNVGYTDGELANPSYQEVCNASGHVEAVYLEYDENIIPLKKIVEHFFRIVDPTQRNRQGHDLGIQYRNGLFFFDQEDQKIIENYIIEEQRKFNKKIQTFCLEARAFYLAEDYHQNYLEKNPSGYCHVNMGLAQPDELA